MKTLNFNVKINAPREKVWSALWEDSTYRKWTSAFSEGSYAESDWNEGSDIRFLSPDGTGMFSRIETKVPNEKMTFKHLGTVEKGVNQAQSDKSEDWAGATESYELKENNNATELIVNMDTTEEYEGYFKEIFPKALNIVKEIAEKK
jgi:uncharacterized protein YndB with AHSA1/START domain